MSLAASSGLVYLDSSPLGSGRGTGSRGGLVACLLPSLHPCSLLPDSVEREEMLAKPLVLGRQHSPRGFVGLKQRLFEQLGYSG